MTLPVKGHLKKQRAGLKVSRRDPGVWCVAKGHMVVGGASCHVEVGGASGVAALITVVIGGSAVTVWFSSHTWQLTVSVYALCVHSYRTEGENGRLSL